MASNFYLYDHTRRPLVEAEAASTPRGWVLNDVARVDFAMANIDPKFLEQNVQYNNLVHIEHVPKTGNHGRLPDWTGVILPRRSWNYTVTNMAAFSAETIMTMRPMPWETLQGTPRSIFLKILERAAAWDKDMVVQPGIIEDMDKSVSIDMRKSAYEAIIDLIKKSGMTWRVTGSIAENRKLELYAHLTVSSGEDTGLQMTNVNSKLHSPVMVEDGIPANYVIGHTQAPTPYDRFEMVGINQGALADYGFMGKSEVFPGIHDPLSLLFATQVYANTFGRPVKRMIRTALDVDMTYDYLDRGNLVDIEEEGVGFKPGGGLGIQGKARIITMNYNDLSDGEVVMNTVLL